MTLLSCAFQNNTIIKRRPEPRPGESVKKECGKLIHAAVINRGFRDRLLADPVKSIEGGFMGEKFSFNREEKNRIKQINARTLEEFALQLVQVIDRPMVSEMAFIRRK